MSKNLFIGNLPFSATEDQLRDLFSPFGEVTSIRLITDRVTGRPRGFGFIEMEAEGATKAIAELNGQDMDGRPLRIDEAQERPPRRD